MDNKEKLSRLNRHENRRSNNKILLFFIVLAVIFIIILFSLIAFGNKSKSDDKIDENENQTSQVENEADLNGNNPSNEEGAADGTSNAPEKSDESNDSEEMIGSPLEDYKVDTPEDLDDNVMEVYSGDWAPVGTTQTGEHATVYDNGSDDRVEIKKAASIVTGITENDMVEWFVGNGGDHQTAIAQVSDKAETAYYKVYLSWVNEQGWQVTRVEKVKSVDK